MATANASRRNTAVVNGQLYYQETTADDQFTIAFVGIYFPTMGCREGRWSVLADENHFFDAKSWQQKIINKMESKESMESAYEIYTSLLRRFSTIKQLIASAQLSDWSACVPTRLWYDGDEEEIKNGNTYVLHVYAAALNL